MQEFQKAGWTLNFSQILRLAMPYLRTCTGSGFLVYRFNVKQIDSKLQNTKIQGSLFSKFY